MTTGTFSQPRVRRIVRVSVKPSMPGISTSESTRSTGSPVSRAAPSRPSTAVVHVVAGALEDHPLQLADADRVLDDEHARLGRSLVRRGGEPAPACACAGTGAAAVPDAS